MTLSKKSTKSLNLQKADVPIMKIENKGTKLNNSNYLSVIDRIANTKTSIMNRTMSSVTGLAKGGVYKFFNRRLLKFSTIVILLFFTSTNGVLKASCPDMTNDPVCSKPFDGTYTKTIEYPEGSGCLVTFNYCIRINGCVYHNGFFYDVYIELEATNPPFCAEFDRDLYMTCLDSVVVLHIQDIPPCEDGIVTEVRYGTPICRTWYFIDKIIGCCTMKDSEGNDTAWRIGGTIKSVPCAEPEICWNIYGYCWEELGNPPDTYRSLRIRNLTFNNPIIDCPPSVYFMDIDGFLLKDEFRNWLIENGMPATEIAEKISSKSKELWERYMQYIYAMLCIEYPLLSACCNDTSAFAHFINQIRRVVSQDGLINCVSDCY